MMYIILYIYIYTTNLSQRDVQIGTFLLQKRHARNRSNRSRFCFHAAQQEHAGPWGPVGLHLAARLGRLDAVGEARS